jgi:hypothetical protein
MAVNYGLYNFAKTIYVVSYSSSTGAVKIIGKHMMRLTDRKNEMRCGIFVAKKLTLADEPLANEALINHVQLNLGMKEYISANRTPVAKAPRKAGKLLAVHDFDRQFKPSSEDIFRN